MAEQGFEMVRYADDFVILCRSPEEAARALAVVQAMDGGSRPDAASDQDARSSMRRKTALTFWAIGSSGGTRFPRPKSLQKLKDTIRAKTKRTSGESLTKIINDLTPTLRGWFEYFKHSHRTTFRNMDGWIRMRLRSILRKRLGTEGTWPRERSSTLAECLLCQARVV